MLVDRSAAAVAVIALLAAPITVAPPLGGTAAPSTITGELEAAAGLPTTAAARAGVAEEFMMVGLAATSVLCTPCRNVPISGAAPTRLPPKPGTIDELIDPLLTGGI